MHASGRQLSRRCRLQGSCMATLKLDQLEQPPNMGAQGSELDDWASAGRRRRKIGRTRTEVGRFRVKLADDGRIRTNLGHDWPELGISAPFPPNPTRLRVDLCDFGRSWPVLDKFDMPSFRNAYCETQCVHGKRRIESSGGSRIVALDCGRRSSLTAGRRGVVKGGRLGLEPMIPLMAHDTGAA